MNIFKMMVIVVCAFALQGCLLTELASDYLNKAVDTNQHEETREIDAQLCEPEILSRLKKTHSDEWYKANVADCEKR